MEAAWCGGAVLWAAALCAVAVGSAVLAALPRDCGAVNTGLAAAMALGMFVTVAWYVAATCRGW